MNQVDKIKEGLIDWAKNENKNIDKDGYVNNVEDNFYLKLSEESVRNLVGGDGSEYPKDDKTRTKIMALHSSSALCCNVFEYWRSRDRKILAKAMGYSRNIKSLVYERKLSMGMQGSKPNLDIFFIMDDGKAVAIESKFTEWMAPKSKKSLFADSYFKDGIERWKEVGLPNFQKLANQLNEDASMYKHLDVAQLLKHGLGLANMHGLNSDLVYLYYDTPDTEISNNHKNEIKLFSDTVGGELNFKAITYQQLLAEIKEGFIAESYINYLESRYAL
tara:strand:+ start:9205 stop:10029 length:825 start_codon:yes stop_codon:yes gene_type:complete